VNDKAKKKVTTMHPELRLASKIEALLEKSELSPAAKYRVITGVLDRKVPELSAKIEEKVERQG
jgi:hypothetical protein